MVNVCIHRWINSFLIVSVIGVSTTLWGMKNEINELTHLLEKTSITLRNCDSKKVKILREELSKKEDKPSYQLNYHVLKKLLQGDIDGVLNPNDEIFSDCTFRRSLHFFACWGDEQCALKLFINYKADPMLVDSNKETPLHVAACYQYTAIVRILLKNVINKVEYVNMQDNGGLTALHNAASRNDVAMCIFLLNTKASPNILDNQKKTVLHLAIQKRCTAEIARLLIEYGADLICKDKRGLTPLDTASGHYYQDSDLVKCLIEQLVVLKNDSKKHILYVVHCSQDVKHFVKTLFILLKIETKKLQKIIPKPLIFIILSYALPKQYDEILNSAHTIFQKGTYYEQGEHDNIEKIFQEYFRNKK